MKRRTLDFLFSVGGLGLAVLLLVLGLVLTSNANFADDYVKDQLSQQKIFFPPAERLSPEEAEVDCLTDNAGKQLTTGKQAECYANEYIGLHVKSTEGADGMTYAELGGPLREAQAELAAAEEAGDPVDPDLEAKVEEMSRARETLFKGETLRGLLLTSYGFSVFGVKAEEISTVTYVAAALLLLLSIAGFVHAFRTPPSAAVGVPERVEPKMRDKDTASV